MRLLLCLLAIFSTFLSTALGAAAPSDTPAAFNAPKLSGLDLQRESLKAQNDSLRHQLGVHPEISGINFELFAPSVALTESDCPALPSSEVESLIASAAKKHALSIPLLRAVMRQESGFKPCAVSIKGAEGLMQLMPATAAQLHVADPFDPEQNVQAGAAFLQQLLKRYNGDLRLALVAYNAGAGRADGLDPSQYPLETQGYLANIFAELDGPDAADD